MSAAILINPEYTRKLLAMSIRGASIRFSYGEWTKVRAAIRLIQRNHGYGYAIRRHPVKGNMIIWRLK